MKIRLLILAAVFTASALQAQTATPTPPPPSILDPSIIQNTLPLALRQNSEKRRIIQTAQQFDASIKQQFLAIYNAVWKNPQGLTPQQVCDALGPLASQLFLYAGTLSGPLNTVHPGIVPESSPAGYTVTPHEDGTVTITYTAPAASPAPTPTP